MRSLLEGAVLLIFAAWVLGTILLQVPWSRNWLRKHDVLLLLPEYRFFAPKPAQGDFHLLFRDHYADGTTSGWTELCPPEDRRVHHALWHPGKRERKALFDITSQLMMVHAAQRAAIHRGSASRLLEATTPYLLLLNYVSAVPRTIPAQKVEFQVLASFGWDSPVAPMPVFSSRQHRLLPTTVSTRV